MRTFRYPLNFMAPDMAAPPAAGQESQRPLPPGEAPSLCCRAAAAPPRLLWGPGGGTAPAPGPRRAPGPPRPARAAPAAGSAALRPGTPGRGAGGAAEEGGDGRWALPVPPPPSSGPELPASGPRGNTAPGTSSETPPRGSDPAGAPSPCPAPPGKGSELRRLLGESSERQRWLRRPHLALGSRRLPLGSAGRTCAENTRTGWLCHTGTAPPCGVN
ncbi:sterile alpha motif domain-containing protein 1-like isoform X2 [Prinia subflava]|uniref:sterile alpha motif domain-containing protein 1-like isoform X2 n=1 Tax=Prinia subflava TaxID=208062 RepID=UPI002FE30B8F